MTTDLNYDDLPASVREALTTLSAAIGEAAERLDLDLLDLVIAARTAIADAWEVCPVHEVDAAICADDDDPECAHLRTGEENR